MCVLSSAWNTECYNLLINQMLLYVCWLLPFTACHFKSQISEISFTKETWPRMAATQSYSSTLTEKSHSHNPIKHFHADKLDSTDFTIVWKLFKGPMFWSQHSVCRLFRASGAESLKASQFSSDWKRIGHEIVDDFLIFHLWTGRNKSVCIFPKTFVLFVSRLWCNKY